MKKALSLFIKDWQSEMRTRYAINALAMFILVTISVILFSIGQEKISEYLTGGLLWVVIFFSAIQVSLIHSTYFFHMNLPVRPTNH
jgi:heme exporter protein B